MARWNPAFAVSPSTTTTSLVWLFPALWPGRTGGSLLPKLGSRSPKDSITDKIHRYHSRAGESEAQKWGPGISWFVYSGFSFIPHRVIPPMDLQWLSPPTPSSQLSNGNQVWIQLGLDPLSVSREACIWRCLSLLLWVSSGLAFQMLDQALQFPDAAAKIRGWSQEACIPRLVRDPEKCLLINCSSMAWSLERLSSFHDVRGGGCFCP